MQWWEGFSRHYMSPEIIPHSACLGAFELLCETPTSVEIGEKVHPDGV